MTWIFEILVGAFFALWLLISVANQLPGRVSELVLKIDKCRLVPSWKFFAPKPRVYDALLVVRFSDANGLLSKWTRPVSSGQRGIKALFWNPERRIQNAVYVSGVALSLSGENFSQVDDICALRVLRAVGMLTLVVAAMDRPQQATAVEFAVLQSAPGGPFMSSAVIYKSALRVLSELDDR